MKVSYLFIGSCFLFFASLALFHVTEIRTARAVGRAGSGAGNRSRRVIGVGEQAQGAAGGIRVQAPAAAADDAGGLAAAAGGGEGSGGGKEAGGRKGTKKGGKLLTNTIKHEDVVSATALAKLDAEEQKHMGQVMETKAKQAVVSKQSFENAMQRKPPPTPEEQRRPPPTTPAAAAVGTTTPDAPPAAAPDGAKADKDAPPREVKLPTSSPEAVPGKGSTPDADVEIEGEGKGECVGITGSEEGFWSEYDPGVKLKGHKPLRYHLKGCKLHRYTQAEARQCLADRHALFIGDSLTRYQYMSLVMFLADAWPDDTGEREGFNPCREAWGQGGWKVFYQTSSTMLKGKETCDCFRKDGPMSRSTQTTLVENRYFHLAQHNLSVTYLQLFGVLPMRGHWPTKECRTKPQGVDGCGPETLAKPEIARGLHVLEDEEYATYLGDGKFDWTGNHVEALTKIVPSLGADALFINLGLWVPTGEYADRKEIEATYRAAKSAVVAHAGGRGQAFWKRTTTSLKCYKTGGKRCNPGDKREVRFFVDKEPVALAKDMGVGIYDTAEPTRTLPWWTWNDEVHFKPFVYRELNNLLFNQLCNSPKASA